MIVPSRLRDRYRTLMSIDQYAVFGKPISHSKSPRIHALFAEQTGQAIAYRAQEVSAEDFASAVKDFFQSGGKGLNCTVPLKELAFQMAEIKSDRAQRAKAVNTLKLTESGQLYGDNTDGVGLLQDIQFNLGLNIEGLKILLLGAGGASRGILKPLLDAKPGSLSIANRTLEKALQLVSEFKDLGQLDALGLDALEGKGFDLILNATAASLSNDLPALPDNLLNEGGSCYDLAYGSKPTPFVLWGRQHHARISVDGIGMLVEQAAEAFYIWRGVRPETLPVIRLLESERSS